MIFLIAFATSLTTLAPTVSFWDCGEFITCTHIFGVPHPPGAPLYILLARLFALFPISSEIAFRVNLLSALVSALTVMLLYLVTVRLIQIIRGPMRTLSDGLIAVAGGIVGALSLAFSDSFWFNAVEAEVYALSIFFTVLIIYLILGWMEKHQARTSDRVLLLIAYLLGLGTGVHLLCLLAAPSILLIVLFVNRRPFKTAKLWLIVPVLFLIGYSTYGTLIIRSGLDPAIDMNNPENWKNFQSFLKREQYGQHHLLPRRGDFWTYQMGLFAKYTLQQFPLSLTDVKVALREAVDNAGVKPSTTVHVSFVPLLLALGGMLHHLRKHRKTFAAFFLLFLLTSVGLVLYLNMPDPEPRERDYVFVGAFALFSVGIGIAGSALIGHLIHLLNQIKLRHPILQGALAATLLLIPASFFSKNHPTHDRSENYVAHELAYKLLQTCEKDSILFTFGDNDTYPLWFLQQVKGIRPDVSVVNLSLLNSRPGWYVKQLRDREPRVPINFSDAFIDEKLTADARASVPVKAAGLSWELQGSGRANILRGGKTETISYVSIADQMIFRIIQQNNWKRPIYFAQTVRRKNLIGLRPYLRTQAFYR